MIAKTIREGRMAIICLSVAVASCASPGREAVPAGLEGMTAPLTEYSELSYPGPSFGKTEERKTAISSDHGFVVLRNDKVIQGAVRVWGQVVSANDKEVVLQSDEGKVTLLYAMPGGKLLPVSPGGKMSISLQPGTLEHWREYTIIDSVDGRLLHMSARENSDGPVHVRLSDDVVLYQASKGSQAENAGQHVVSSIPVMVRVKGKITEVSGKEKAEVDIDGVRYSVMVLNSIESRPAPGYESQSEGQGYWLECVMVKQQ